MTLGQTAPGKDLKNRYFAVGGGFLFGMLLLVVQAYRLQVTRHDEFVAKSEANFIKDVRLRADRGMIRDDHGTILVDSRPSYDLFVTPGFCDKCRTEVLPKLADYLRMPAEEMTAVADQIQSARRNAPYVPIPVKIDLDRDMADLIQAHIKLEKLVGVEVLPVQHRHYRTGTVLSHVLGYMNEIQQDELDKMAKQGRTGFFPGDFIGRRGLERFFESKLRGTDGVKKVVVNARGEEIAGLADLIHDEGKPAVPGNNLVLSIDMRLQAEAERAFPGLAGAVVAIDVKTGFIKAIVSRPGFDPNALTGRITGAEMAALSKDPLQPMIFRPTQQHYSPGSTFKVFTALTALRSGKYTPNTSVYCNGGYRLGSRVWRCDKESGHGPIAMRQALQMSCDVYFYKLGDTVGIDAIADTGHKFGLGLPTGIGVVAEVPGIMPDTAYYEKNVQGGYQKGMALNTAIGQGDDNVTPLQLAMAYATIANGGTLFQPQLVRRIETPDGQLVQQFEPKARGQVQLTEEERHVIVDGLKAVVNEPGGTGGAARLPDITVAGKTGTAQVVRLGAVRLKAHQIDYWQRDNAWFASFAPAEDPEIVVVVLNEHAGFGASGAAPVAGAVLKKYFELKRIDAGEPIAQVLASSNAKPTAKPTAKPNGAAAPAKAATAPGGPDGALPPPPATEEDGAAALAEAAHAAEDAAHRAKAELSLPPDPAAGTGGVADPRVASSGTTAAQTERVSAPRGEVVDPGAPAHPEGESSARTPPPVAPAPPPAPPRAPATGGAGESTSEPAPAPPGNP